jgi:hypothetical protein
VLQLERRRAFFGSRREAQLDLVRASPERQLEQVWMLVWMLVVRACRVRVRRQERWLLTS